MKKARKSSKRKLSEYQKLENYLSENYVWFITCNWSWFVPKYFIV